MKLKILVGLVLVALLASNALQIYQNNQTKVKIDKLQSNVTKVQQSVKKADKDIGHTDSDVQDTDTDVQDICGSIRSCF